VSDLYADRWKSEVDRSDFPTLSPVARLKPAAASKMAFEADATDRRCPKPKLKNCYGPMP